METTHDYPELAAELEVMLEGESVQLLSAAQRQILRAAALALRDAPRAASHMRVSIEPSARRLQIETFLRARRMADYWRTIKPLGPPQTDLTDMLDELAAILPPMTPAEDAMVRAILAGERARDGVCSVCGELVAMSESNPSMIGDHGLSSVQTGAPLGTVRRCGGSQRPPRVLS